MSKTYPPDNSGVCPCTCGALPYGVGVRTDGTVGLTKYRKSSSTQIDAKARWNAHRFRYGPLKEEDK